MCLLYRYMSSPKARRHEAASSGLCRANDSNKTQKHTTATTTTITTDYYYYYYYY